MDQREVCDCDKITFQHVKSSLHLSVNSQGQRNNRHFDFTLTEDDLELESQFKLLQLEKFYCYYAIGFSSFLCDSYIMLHYDDRNLVAIIKKEIKEKMTELEKLCKTKGFIRMLQCLTIFINEKETSHAKFGKTRLCIERKTTCVQNEEESTDTANDAEGDEADDAAIDLHIQKETYRASLEQPENMEWTLPVPIQEFFSNLPIADATTFLMKSDTIDDNRIKMIIMSCLKGYIDKNYVIDLENTGRGFAINATLVFRLLFLLHLLFIKYVYISTKERNTENNSPPSNNGSRLLDMILNSIKDKF
ncbi:PREDICTED: uncharacterized protein LOC109591650 [Amphimedon queenslandica]|uniref:Uncharacterized protein n=2 Tax=Amphimedon queenslandica TaxID=400682 RepID=A0AAN0K155_AMPQE|nr:PREDICTED: uncharacterized protein LOC109591650 [Amphimedon queenslandica]|eukprot:XP_019862898.1 PREDICTED: uncharacterized protein LOC109591650 [Amphimedon queenslandica]